MREINHLLASSIASIALLGVSHAQQSPLDYSSNWQPLHSGANIAFSGPGLFGVVAGTGSPLGGTIRRCYGIDSTQGGRNQSAGQYGVSWYKIVQGYGQASSVPGVNIGLVSIQSGTDGDLGSDTCISPFGKSSVGSGGHKVAASAFLGVQTGSAGGPFPQIWASAFQWIGTSLGSPVTLGADASGSPLLINMIYEIQGPLNNPQDIQYYLASTTEVTGSDPNAPGGVANGNASLGINNYGVPATLSGAHGHSRIMVSGPGGLIMGPYPFLSLPGDVEAASHVAFRTPVLWGINDGNDGAGGPDWHVGAAPVSIIDVRMLDNLAGAQTNHNVYWKTTLPTIAPAAGFDPNIAFNQSFFLWSATPAGGMLQNPMSWDDMGGLVTPQPGSIALGALLTKRQGPQTVPANHDALMVAVLPVAALSLGTQFSGSDDIFLDGTVTDASGSHSQLWEGTFDPIISGVSTLSRGPRPIVGIPSPALVGMKLGLAGFGLQIDLSDGHYLQVTEVASAMTVNLQL